MQEKTEVALIARIFLCYYYFFFLHTNIPVSSLSSCCVVVQSRKFTHKKKKVWYHVKVCINASCLAESESLNTFIFTSSKNTVYELLLFFKSLRRIQT